MIFAVAIATASFVFAAVQPAPHHRADCPGADPALAAVLDMSLPAVRSACSRGDAFMAALRTELLRHLDDRARLWRQGLDNADTPAALDAWREGRLVSLPGGRAWPVPRDPDWTEDPYRNLSWLAGYHSLAWLTTIARGYRTGDQALGDEIQHYLLSWIASNTVEQPPSIRSWYDGAVHRRTNAIVAIWDVLLQVLDDDGLATVLVSLHEHGTQLHSFLTRERFYGHNHNLFHSLSLVNLAKNVPLLADASSWDANARLRLHSLLREMVNPVDGVSTEQASTYHYLAMRLFAEAQGYLVPHDGLAAEDLQLLAEMTRFGALLPDPAGTLPAIGDTAYGASDATGLGLLRRFREMRLTTPEAEFVLSRGRRGARPADASFFEGEGYAILRPSYGEVGDWEDDLHIVVDMGPGARVHGHDDAMNILVAAYGEQLVVDSGGPYQYGVDDRRAFTHAAAHNTVLVDGRGYEAGDVGILRTLDRPLFSLVTGAHEKSTGVHHRRTVMVVKPWLVLVLDDLRGTDGQPHRFDLLYHLPPDATVTVRGSRAEVRAGRAAMGLTVAADQAVSTAVRRGETDPLFGWVTTANARREPAPILEFSQRATTAWYVTAILPSPVKESVLPDVAAQRTGEAFRIEVRAGRDAWTIVVPDEAEPIVEFRSEPDQAVMMEP